jgi:hypothetical protein
MLLPKATFGGKLLLGLRYTMMQTIHLAFYSQLQKATSLEPLSREETFLFSTSRTKGEASQTFHLLDSFEDKKLGLCSNT